VGYPVHNTSPNFELNSYSCLFEVFQIHHQVVSSQVLQVLHAVRALTAVAAATPLAIVTESGLSAKSGIVFRTAKKILVATHCAMDFDLLNLFCSSGVREAKAVCEAAAVTVTKTVFVASATMFGNF
jgi:hypothetical protein